MTRRFDERRPKRRKAKGEGPEASEPKLGPKRAVIVGVTGIVLVASVVGFSLYRFYRVDAPARALERWAEATRQGECDASFEGLSSSVKEASLLGEKDNWCQIIGSPNFIGTISVEKTYRSRSKACVVAEIHNPDESVHKKAFIMNFEDGAWKVELGADPASSGISGCPST